MTESAYKSLSLTEQLFKDLVYLPGVKAMEIYLEAQVPVLRFPLLKSIFEYVVEGVSDRVFQALVLAVDVTAIQLVNAAHQSAFEDAVLKLRVIAEESGADSEAFKTAREEAKLALSRFVRYSPTA